MVYSLSLLRTFAQCDAVLAFAADKLGVLTFRNTESTYRVGNTSDTAKDLSDELQGLNIYINAITPVVTTLAPGKEQDNLANELRQKTDRRDELVARQGKVGPEKLVSRELEQALLDPQIPIVQDFIAQVTAHRGTLTA
ncbi:hypothetical protein [Hymenobacter terrenus]|uniref:hypothetical protein n=1 Tax=Hymenobacter terrenus TaxID=1629124 RepID=UPI00061931D3|nr:hypothetical protein [Hymenobacter terrenus]